MMIGGRSFVKQSVVKAVGMKAQSRRNGGISLLSRKYHSYPDPNEKAQISTFVSKTTEKQIDKSSGIFSLKNDFKLDTAFPGVPLHQGISDKGAPVVHQTKLPNGLLVASNELPGSFMVTLGFLVKCGSAYEVQSGDANNTGATQFLELNAFHATHNRSHEDIVVELERIGAIVQCVSLRENIFYCVDVLKDNVETALDILADTILNPTFPEEELEMTRQIIQYQSEELPAEVFSRDLVQRAAYNGYPMGNYHYCPENRLAEVTQNTLHNFRSKYFYGDNCVFSCVGLEHQVFLDMVSKRFQNLPNKSDHSVVQLQPTKYTGGLMVEERNLKDPNFIKVAMAFEVGGWNSPDLVPVCVLQQLLGGGSSFSAGGPGKGMFTRLYTQVLNRHHWSEAVEAFTCVNEETGLLGIDTSCPPSYFANAIAMAIEQFSVLAVTPVSDEELSRAKNMLKSMMMMNLESRLMICEDIARQLITYGHRKSPTSLCDTIDKVTAQDLMRIAAKIVAQRPSISIVGNAEQLKMEGHGIPPYENIVYFMEQTKLKIAQQKGSSLTSW